MIGRDEAERLAREALPHSGRVITLREDSDGWFYVFSVDTLDRPGALVDKKTGHVEVGTVFDDATFDRIEAMTEHVYIDEPPAWAR